MASNGSETADLQTPRDLPVGQAECGWPDCCGGDPRGCWQPSQKAERGASDAAMREAAHAR